MFKDKLRELREGNEWSMDKLAEIYNAKFNGKLNKSTISRYENGLQDPLYTVVRNLAYLFNISVDEMIDETQSDTGKPKGIKPNETWSIIRILRKWRNATVNDIEQLTNIPYHRLKQIDEFCSNLTPDEISQLANALGVTEYMISEPFLPLDMADPYIQKLGRVLRDDDYKLLELYSKLDIDDRAEIRVEIKHMLKADKYNKKDITKVFNDVSDELSKNGKGVHISTK